MVELLNICDRDDHENKPFFFFDESDEIEVMFREQRYVRFADPLVTKSWTIPRKDASLKSILFYSPVDIAL